ncbi:hypothetical protein HKCCE3408_11615 [Rhodobacterales bacterium HKCCE3408]|nr:hypothetical protein [Rhodobacterales bacterium HKCCE3408]
MKIPVHKPNPVRPTSRRPDPPGEGRRCHRCAGSGRSPCSVCGGQGRTLKAYDRNGTPQFDRCDGCFGTRTARCSVCSGEGFL